MTGILHLSSHEVNDLVDGRLDSARLAAAEQHLAECEMCRALFDELRHVIACARAAAEIPPPADLWPLIVAQTVRGVVLRRAFLRRWAPGLAAAAVTLFVSGAFVGSEFQSHPSGAEGDTARSAVASPSRFASVASPAREEDSVAFRYVMETQALLRQVEDAEFTRVVALRMATDSLVRFERELDSLRSIYRHTRAPRDWLALGACYRRRLAFAASLARF